MSVNVVWWYVQVGEPETQSSREVCCYFFKTDSVLFLRIYDGDMMFRGTINKGIFHVEFGC